MPRASLLATLAVAGVLAACSSAPPPDRLSEGRPTLAPSGPSAPSAGAPLPNSPGASNQQGTTGGTAGTTGGAGTTGTAGGVQVGPSTGPRAVAPTVSHLFTAAEDRIGITDKVIRMCAHAALTYGAAFNTTADDFNVFWTSVNEEKNGVFGRKVEVTYENDNYDPNTAVEAATACKAKGIFMLLGGIGFDQIPNVRNWAETNHQLYLHHTATVNGSKGLKYSFTELPSVERMGEGFAQLYLSKYRGKKVGIVERDSANWKPGADAFRAALALQGIQVVKDNKVADKKHNYTQDILDMKNAGAEVVFLWENALNSTEFIVQAKRQVYSPQYLMFPFNLTSQTLGADALNPPLDGVAMYPAYSMGDYSGTFAAYADDMKLFEQQYRKYRPNADLSGFGGDLLFLNWTAQKALYAQLLACGKDCSRNRFVDVLQGWHSRPTSSACVIDFTKGDGHHGAEALVFMQTYTAPSGKVNWRNTRACVGRP
jgi:ABC-type branched-subunit amino acid transport system substrate-binding protein